VVEDMEETSSPVEIEEALGTPLAV